MTPSPSTPSQPRTMPLTATDAAPVPTSRFRTWVARHPVAAFLLIGPPLSLALMAVPAMAQLGLVPGKDLPGRLGLDMEEVASILLVVTIFLTALGVTAAESGRDGVRLLLRRMARWQVPVRWWLLATLAIPVATIALALLFGDRATVPALPTLGAEIVAILIAFLFVNLWEEAVWAGFMQTRLERRHRLFTAAALTAVPFAAVHMPLRVITGDARTAGELLSAFVVLTVFMVFLRTLLGIVLRGARNSVLVVAAAHTMFNRSNNVDGIAADILSGPNRQNAALLATVVLTVVLAVVVRRRLTRSHRRVLDAAELEGASR